MIDSTPIDCSKCGQVHRRCTAHKKGTLTPCKNIRMKGQNVCQFHGGKTPAAREAGLRRYAVQKALADSEALIAHNAEEGVADPIKALQILATEALGMKDALAARVNALTSVRFEDDKGGEQLRSEVILYERALDRAAKFLDLLARSGFEEKRIMIAQREGQMIVELLRRVFSQINLTPEQETIVGEVVPRELKRFAQQGDPQS